MFVAGAPKRAPISQPPGTSIGKLRALRDARRKELQDEVHGTLSTDVERFLPQIAGRVSWKTDRSNLRAWLSVTVPASQGVPLGTLSRARLTHEHLNQAIQQWRSPAPGSSEAVVAAQTIRHRLRVLRELYRKLDGRQAAEVVFTEDVAWPAKPKPHPAGVPVEIIEGVLVTLAELDAKTHARFAVAATCAQRPCQIGRARPEDVNLDAGLWIVRGAKGGPAHTVTLGPVQRAAWQAFIAADAWGEFDTSKYGKLIHQAGWPKGIRPYTVRHAFAIDAIRRGVSLGDVQALLGHADPTMTRVYAPFVVERQHAVTAMMRDYLSDVFAPIAPERTNPQQAVFLAHARTDRAADDPSDTGNIYRCAELLFMWGGLSPDLRDAFLIMMEAARGSTEQSGLFVDQQ
ncbi:MAG: tyrosine-type recombinase/integrase [Burkholderiales bacterium]